jgi:hypothetical protein
MKGKNHNQKIRNKRRKYKFTRRLKLSEDEKKCRGLPIIQRGDYMIGGGDAHSGVFASIKAFLIGIKDFFARILKNSYRSIKELLSIIKDLTVLLLKTFFIVDYDMLFPIRTVYTEYQKNIIEIMKYFYARACSPPYVRFSQLFTLFSILKEYRDETGWKGDANEFELVDPVDNSNLDGFTPIYHKSFENKDRSNLFSILTKEILSNPLKLDMMQDIYEGIELGTESMTDSMSGMIDSFKRAFHIIISIFDTIYQYIKSAGSSIKDTIKGLFSSKKSGKKIGGMRKLTKRKHKFFPKKRSQKGGLFQDSTESLKQKSLMTANKAKASTEYVGALFMSDRARKQARLRYFVDRYVAIGNDYMKEKKANVLSNVIINLYLLKEGIGAGEFKNKEGIETINSFFNKMPYVNAPEFKNNIELLKKINTLRIKDTDYYKKLSEILNIEESAIPNSEDTEDKQKFHTYLIKKIKACIEENIIDNVSLIGRDYKVKVKKGYTIDVNHNGIWRPAIVTRVVKNKKVTKDEKDSYTFTVKLKDGEDTIVTFNTNDSNISQNIMEHFDRFVPGESVEDSESNDLSSDKPSEIKEQNTEGGGVFDAFTSAVYINKPNESYNDRFPMILPIMDINKVQSFRKTTITQIHRIIDSFGVKRENVIRLNNIDRVSYKIEEMDFYNKILKDCIDDLILSGDTRFKIILRRIALDNLIYNQRIENQIDTFSGFKVKTLGIPAQIDETQLKYILDNTIAGKINRYYNDKIKLEKDFNESKGKLSMKSVEELDKQGTVIENSLEFERLSLLSFLLNIDHKQCVNVLFSIAPLSYSISSFRNKSNSFYSGESAIENQQQQHMIAKSSYKLLLKFLNEEIDEVLFESNGSYKNIYGPNVTNRLYKEATSRVLFTQFLQQDVKNRITVFIENCSMEELNDIIRRDNINKRNKILSEHIIDIWDMYTNAKPYKSNYGSFSSVNSNIKTAILKGLDEKFKDTFRELLLLGSDEDFAAVLSSLSQISFISPLLAVCMTMYNNPLEGHFSPGCIISGLSAIYFLCNITCTSSIIPPEMQGTISEINSGLSDKNKETERNVQAVDETEEAKQNEKIEKGDSK